MPNLDRSETMLSWGYEKEIFDYTCGDNDDIRDDGGAEHCVCGKLGAA